jgi:hypothetical protein
MRHDEQMSTGSMSQMRASAMPSWTPSPRTDGGQQQNRWLFGIRQE